MRSGICMDHMNQTDEPPPWMLFGSVYREAKLAASYHTKDGSNSTLESPF